MAERTVYSSELEKTLRNTSWNSDLTSYKQLEERLIEEFSNSEVERRGGTEKTSVTYLLLKSNIIASLHSTDGTSRPEVQWKTFLSAIFYVGQGKKTRPLDHIREAAKIWQNNCYTTNEKINSIIRSWENGASIIYLCMYPKVIPEEAFSREAAMISALKLDNLTNQINSTFYGRGWSQKSKEKLGVYLLYQAMNIFFDQERCQLFDIKINRNGNIVFEFRSSIIEQFVKLATF
ncbi:ankyrin repeat and LEM domain-containing protein 1 [Rhynchophorus ferrugineus]|uniref:ankyrin repeat and LEM domain-containing protein 1 n=1 Tax=Rhynchophorus ferrugineus TaxID=354439 RepID=UPI003FCC93C4